MVSGGFAHAFNCRQAGQSTHHSAHDRYASTRAGVYINTIRGWLGHVLLSITYIYAEIDRE